MKKIYALSGVLMLMGIAMTGCKDNTDPTIQEPTAFVLNTPPMVNYLYDLAGDHESTIDISVSQPDYGMATFPVYSVQISLTGEFAQPYNSESNSGDYYELYGTFSQVDIKIPAEMFSVGTTALLGYTNEDERPYYVDQTLPVYMRVISRITNWAPGTIASNVVLLPKVRPYFALRQPGIIYVVGESPFVWSVEAPNATLSESTDAIGSKIYYGTFDAPASDSGNFGPFRFYTALGDWESNSIGTQVDDNPIEFDYLDDEVFVDGVFSGDAVAGKGSWTITNWPGGKIKMTVDLNEMKVEYVHLD